MKDFLVIGSYGTLGSEFERLLGEQALCVDRDQLDITDEAAVRQRLAEWQPKVVINCAAYTNVDQAESDYDTAVKLNGTILGYLSEACNNIGARLIHFSTGMVFPGTDSDGYNEDSPTQPVNKYGESKLAGEKVIQQTAQSYYIVRTEWLYGQPQSETAKKSFVELMIELGKSGKVKGVIDEVGKPTWSKDLAVATLGLINSHSESGIYHLVNEGQASRMDWAAEIYRQQKMAVELEPVSGTDFPRPAARPPFEILNNTKFAKLRPWQEALKEYLSTKP